MKVRFGTEADIPLIMELSREYNQLEGVRDNYKLDEEYFEPLLRWIINEEDFNVIIPESNDGMLLFTKSNFLWNPEPYLLDLAFFVREGCRGKTTTDMIAAYEDYAKQHGIKHVMLGMSSQLNHKQLERYYRFKGYKPYSIDLLKEV